MPLITLTSDLGVKDHNVAAIKGSILSEKIDSTIVDISHLIQPFNILEASFIVRNAFHHFPKRSIHIVYINVSEGPENRFLLADHNDHYFLGCDNGIFPLIFENSGEVSYFEIDRESGDKNKRNEFLSVIRKVVRSMSEGTPVSGFGKKVYELQQRTSLQPVIYSDVIRGSVFYIDRFSNAIANIRRETFNEKSGDRDFQIIFNRNAVDQLSYNYGDVPEGEKLCFFNSSGYLEIAINKGKASSLLGLEIGSNVLIEFS